MNEAKQAHVGLLPLVGGAVLPAYDSPRLRSAARSPVSRDLNRLATRFTPHQIPKRKQVYCDFGGSFFGDVGMPRKIFRRPETLKFKPYFRWEIFCNIVLTVGSKCDRV